MSSQKEPQAIHLLPCTSEDIPACAEITSLAFGHSAPFVDIFFPEHDTPTGSDQLISRLRSWLESDPHASFLKAEVEKEMMNEDGSRATEIAGFAVWTHMLASRNPPPTELAEVEDIDAVWGTKAATHQDAEAEKLFVKQIWTSYVEPRRSAILKAQNYDRGVMVLELLAVRPDFQGMGAGVKLTKWGCDKADEAGIQGVVEATPNAQRCYEKCGFKVETEEIHFKVGDEFKGRKLPILRFMRRTGL